MFLFCNQSTLMEARYLRYFEHSWQNKLNGWIGLSIITSDLLLCCMNNIAKYMFEIAFKIGRIYFLKQIFALYLCYSEEVIYGDNTCDMSFFTSLLRYVYFLKGMNRRFPYMAFMRIIA